MNDDLNISEALAVIYTAVRDGNSLVAAGDAAGAAAVATDVVAMLDVLGVNPFDAHWAAETTDSSSEALAVLVESLLTQRSAARAEKDFATSDRIRDQLSAAGVTVADNPDGATWSLSTDGKH